MPNKHIPFRKCIGCGISKPKENLIRISCIGGNLILNLSGKENGRGVYICKDDTCIERAFKNKGLARSLRRSFSEADLAKLKNDIAAAREVL